MGRFFSSVQIKNNGSREQFLKSFCNVMKKRSFVPCSEEESTLSCNNDQTLFEPCSWDGGQVSPTLTKQNAGGS